MTMKKTVKKPKARIIWGFNPVSRVVPSKKRYSRKQNKNMLKKENFLF